MHMHTIHTYTLYTLYTHIYIHTIHTHTHYTYIHTHTHTLYICTYILVFTYIHADTHKHTNITLHIHTHTHILHTHITLRYTHTHTFNTPSNLFILGPVNALWSRNPMERTADNASRTTGRYHYTSTAPLIMAVSKSCVSWTYEIRGKINLTDI